MKKIVAFALASAMSLSLVACGGAASSAASSSTESAYDMTAVDYITYNITSEDKTVYASLNRYDTEYFLEYSLNDSYKSGAVDAAVFEQAVAVLADADLEAMSKLTTYGDSSLFMGVSAGFSDGQFFGCDVQASEIPAELSSMVEALEAIVVPCAETLEELEESANVTIAPAADADCVALIQQVMAEAEANEVLVYENMIQNVPVAEENMLRYYSELTADAASSLQGGASSVDAMNIAAHMFTVLKLAEGADAAALAQQIADNVDWSKFVCVMPSMMMTATAEVDGVSYVAYLLSNDYCYAPIAAALQNNGFTVVAEAAPVAEPAADAPAAAPADGAAVMPAV